MKSLTLLLSRAAPYAVAGALALKLLSAQSAVADTAYFQVRTPTPTPTVVGVVTPTRTPTPTPTLERTVAESYQGAASYSTPSIGGSAPQPVPVGSGAATMVIITTIIVSLAAVVGYLLFRRRVSGDFGGSFSLDAESRNSEHLQLQADVSRMVSESGGFADLYRLQNSWGRSIDTFDSQSDSFPPIFRYESVVGAHSEHHASYKRRIEAAAKAYDYNIELSNAYLHGIVNRVLGLVSGRSRKARKLVEDNYSILTELLEDYKREDGVLHGRMLEELSHVKAAASEMRWRSIGSPLVEFSLMSHLDPSTPLEPYKTEEKKA